MAKTEKNGDTNKSHQSTALKGLSFVNPGPALGTFNPEQSARQERKLQRLIQQAQKKGCKRTTYDDGGHLVTDGRDLCDCLMEKCPGCFYPCEKCRSTKCGVECRCLRKWRYETTDVEGGVSRSFPEGELA